MLGIALIVFREVVEAALVVGVVLAASRGVPRRGLWVSGGVLAGILGASLVAAFTGEIASALNGFGQEVFNATVLFAAVAMLGWHNVWMGSHGKEMSAQASSIGNAVRLGARSLSALAIVVGLATLREGSEIVLFVYGLAAAQGSSLTAIASGGGLGVMGGVLIGAAIYGGLLSVPVRHLFAVTSGLILLLAAGMASQGAAFLLQADLVPTFGDQLWDTSRFLSEQSLVGQMLHALVGYVSRPTGIQIIFYLSTLAIIGGLMRYFGRRPPRAPRRAVTAAT